MPSPAAPNADRLLRQHRRWTDWAWPLTVVAVGLGATLFLNWRLHPTLARVEQWHDLPRWWLAGLALTGALAAAAWGWRRGSLLQSARQLDERFDARNRLETSAALRGDAGALALAQREEAASFLQGRAAAPTGRRAVFLALCALAAALGLAHLVTLVSWTRPWLARAAVAPPPPAKPPAAPLPQARIRWKSPASETKAAPVEEVPLAAVASSTGGLKEMTLEIAVNGQPRLSVPLPSDALKDKGEHAVQASIYLDQLEVEPFDVVSYYLRARRIDARALPETVSSVQFVQVRPLRSDVREGRGSEGFAGFALVTALKVAQLRLLKENFVLAHAELGQEDAAWKKEDARVGGEQGALEKKTGEAVEQMIAGGVPAEVVNLLMQARPLMGEAGQKILAAANDPALAPQGKALGLITEVEKFGVKMAARDGKTHGSKPNVDDPFKDKQQFELKQRFKTAAGELETLAAAQAALADELARADAPAPAPDANQPADPDKIEGTPAERQTQISQRVGALLNGRVFNEEITRHLEAARDRARESLGHLDENDGPAAREPAASAARELQLAAEAVDRAGEEEAKLQLADAQHTLNEAADLARDAARQENDETARQREQEAEARAKQAAQDLADHAREQQEAGSADAAKRLNDLAKSARADDLRKSLERLRAQPRDPARAQAAADRLQQLADAAAQARHPGTPAPEELARLVDLLERDRVNLQRLAANDPGPAAARGETPPTEPKGGGPAGDKPGGQSDPKKSESAPPGSGEQKDSKQEKPGGQSSPGKSGSNPPKSGGQDSPKKDGASALDGRGKGPAGQPSPGGEPRGQGRGPQGQPGQGQDATPQDLPSGKGQRGKGNAPGQQPSRDGKGRGGRGGSAARDDHDDPPDAESQGSGPGKGKPDLGDTYGTSVGETRSGPVPAGAGAAEKPVYTDHAPRDAQTRPPGQARQEFARELLQDVREAAQEAAALAPHSGALAELREALRAVPQEPHYTDRAALFAVIDPPLLGLIDALRAEAQGLARRSHPLTDPDLDQALPAYRAAVADYFEDLSRDYDAAPPTPSPTPE